MIPELQFPEDQSFDDVLNATILNGDVAKVLVDLLHATKVQKNGVVVPDWSTRFEAAKMISAYKVGLPIPRKEVVVVQHSGGRQEAFIERMARYPSVLQSVKDMVVRAEALQRELEKKGENWNSEKS